MSPQIGKELLYLTEAEVSSLGITMREIIEVLERAFREKAEGRVEMPPKIGIHSQADSFLHAMPALIPSTRAAGMKWVGGYPANFRRGLPYISGLLILNDYETGIPIAVMDCTWITAERTAAATAVAAKYLARPESAVVGMLACGVQARANLRALQAVLPVREVRAYDIDAERAGQFGDFARSLGVGAEVVSEPRKAVAGCEVVVTSGPILRKPHATIQRGWFERGAFASLVDFDSYWHPAALHEADKFCTDDVPQLNHYRDIGYFQDVPPVYAELADLVTGRKPGRQSLEERTMACNLGLALEDLAVAPLVYERAQEKGVGTWLPL